MRILFVLGALSLGVFALPYAVPSHATILSASFLAGFNNSFAYAWWVIGLIIGGLVLSPLVSGERGREALASTAPLFSRPPAVVIVVALAHVVLFGALYVKAHGFTFGEPLYFQDAAYRARSGAVPFIDFYFFYGPLMISPVAWLARFVGLFPAYGIYYVATYVTGLYLLYVVLAALAGRRHLVLWYVLFAVGFFNPITGLNYTFVRFMLPLVTMLAVWRAYQTPALARWVTAVGFFTASVLCSPDTAVVVVGSVGVLGTVLLWADSPTWMTGRRGGVLISIPLGALALAAGAMLLIDGTWHPLIAYLTPVITFSAGGWSTPIDPSPPMLSLLAASLLTVTLLWKSGREAGRTPAVAMLAALAVLVLLMQRASLGKSDIQHIAFSGLPAFMIAASWVPATALRGRAQTWMAALLLVGVVASLQFYHAMLFLPSLFQKRTQASTTAVAAPRAATKAEIQASIDKAVRQFGTHRLYYMHRLEYYRLPIYDTYRLTPFEYQPTLASAFTAKDIQDVIDLLRGRDVVVLATKTDLAVMSPVTPIPTRWWFYATSSPLPGSQIFNWTREFQARLEAPLVRTLNTEYDRVFDDGDVVGLVRRSQ